MAVGLRNINSYPSTTSQGSDLLLGQNYSATVDQLLAYIAGTSSPVVDSTRFLMAPRSTGRLGVRSGLQIKNHVNGGISPIRNSDLLVLQRGNVFYKTTLAELTGGSSGGTLATPDNFSAIAATVDSISLDWDAVTDATSYTLQRSLNEFFTTVTTIYTGATSSYSDTGLDTTTTYYYRVKATAGGFTDSAYTSVFETPANATFDISALSGQIVAHDVTNPTGRVLNGSRLAYLPNKVAYPYNMDLTGPSVAYQPLYFGSGGSNDLPFVRVDSGRLFGYGAAIAEIPNSPISFYVVVRIPVLTDAKRLFYYNNVNQEAGPIIYDSLDAIGVYTGVDTYGFKQAAYTTDWMVLRVVVKANNSAFIRVNKDPDFAISTSGTNSSSPLSTFLFGNAASSAALNEMEVSESRIFNRVLTEAEDISVMNYLTGKYQVKAPVKTLMAFGDSHVVGVQSGTSGLTMMDIVTGSEGFKTSNFAFSGSVMRDYGYGQTPGMNLYDLYTGFNKAKWANYYVLFEYGTNDAATWTVDSKNITTVKADYKAAIQSFLTAGFAANKIVICTPPYSTGTYVDGKLPAIVTAVQAIASELGIKLADLYTAMQGAGYNCATVSGGDGIHMNGTMHAFCATTIINAINS